MGQILNTNKRNKLYTFLNLIFILGFIILFSLNYKKIFSIIKIIFRVIINFDVPILIKLLLLFWSNYILLSIYDLFIFVLDRFNTNIYIEFRCVDNVYLARFIAENYYFFNKFLRVISPDIVFITSETKNKFIKSGYFTPVNSIEKLKIFLFSPFSFKIWNFIIWIIILLQINYFSNLLNIQYELNRLKNNYFEYKTIIQNNLLLITQFVGLIGVVNFIKIKNIFSERRKQRKMEAIKYQEEIIKNAKKILPKLNDNIDKLFKRKEMIINRYLKELTGVNYLYYEDGELKTLGTFSSKSNVRGESLFNFLNAIDEPIDSIEKIIDEITKKDMINVFIKTNYYNAFEYIKLGRTKTRFIENDLCYYLNRNHMEKRFQEDDENIKEFFKNNFKSEKFNLNSYQKQRIEEKLNQFISKLYYFRAEAIEEYIYLEQYIRKYIKFKQDNIVYKLIDVVKK